MSTEHTRQFSQPLVTENGTSIQQPVVSYRTWGELNRQRDNAVLVLHALTGNSRADEWFEGLFGPGKTLDPRQQFIICPNVLGSCYGTTGPASTKPESGKPYRMDFPQITIRDMVRLHQRLLDKLGIAGLELVIGGSMGGMQALEFCIMDPRPRAAVLLGMGKSHSPWAIGISHNQRQAIFNDPRWKGGTYPEEDPPAEGLALARMIAMNSYRSPSDFQRKFGRRLQEGSALFEVESYLNYQGDKLAKRFDACSYVRLSQAMDRHDVARNRGSYPEILDGVRMPILIMGIDTDMLYPVEEQKELARLLPKGEYAEISSPYGHDAFLIEFDQINKRIREFAQSQLIFQDI